MTGRASGWQPAAMSREEYAARAVSPGYARALAANPPGAASNPNLLAFGNSGGLLRNGVCWWHSRFTRAALYLVYFEPSKPKPDARTARKAIRSLMNADRVVEIQATPASGISRPITPRKSRRSSKGGRSRTAC